MGVLVAHTVVLVLDGEWVSSGFCKTECETFRTNCERAREFWCGQHSASSAACPIRTGCAWPVGPVSVLYRRRRSEHSGAPPGSEFQLIVVYEKDMSVAELERARACVLHNTWATQTKQHNCNRLGVSLLRMHDSCLIW